MVDRERSRATQRERLSRMTSHEMRTPATIAMGYVDLLLVQEQDVDRRADLEVVLDELERLILASDRLVRMLWIPDQDGQQEVDLDRLLAETAERWSVLADRDWKVTSASGLQYCSLDRIRACLDTLVENAVRYTNEGDVVRLISFERDGNLMVGVADSGPGLEPGVAASINEMREDASVAATFTAADPKSQTGLGLGLVREAVAARGGKILAGRSDEGGASVLMVLPTDDRVGTSKKRPEDQQDSDREPVPTPSLHLDGSYR
jgi:signal transduction histidine kinase